MKRFVVAGVVVGLAIAPLACADSSDPIASGAADASPDAVITVDGSAAKPDGSTAPDANTVTDATSSDANNASDASDGSTPIDAAPDAPSGVSLTVRHYLKSSALTQAKLGNAPFFAFRDGDGPWTAVTGTNGVYDLRVASAFGRFGFAWACGERGFLGTANAKLQTIYASVRDFTSINIGCRDLEIDQGRGAHEITAAPTNVPSGHTVSIFASERSNTSSLRLDTGVYDIGIRATSASGSVSRLVFFAAENITAPKTFAPNLANDGIATVPTDLLRIGIPDADGVTTTVTYLPSELPSVQTLYSATRVAKIPVIANRLNQVQLAAKATAAGEITRTATAFIDSTTALTLDAAPVAIAPWPAPVCGGNPVVCTTALPAMTSFKGVVVGCETFSGPTGGAAYTWATPDWLGNAATIASPDLRGLPGWQPNVYEMKSGGSGYCISRFFQSSSATFAEIVGGEMAPAQSAVGLRYTVHSK